VFLAGWQSQPELPDFFSAAEAVVLTSEREQFGQVLVEGMACGLPAIATRSLGPSAIIDDGQTGWLVEPDDEMALARALSDAVQHKQERERRGQLARISACQHYSWAGASEQLAAVLEEVVAGIDTPELLQTGDDAPPEHSNRLREREHDKTVVRKSRPGRTPWPLPAHEAPSTAG
jgi:glycogen synthase